MSHSLHSSLPCLYIYLLRVVASTSLVQSNNDIITLPLRMPNVTTKGDNTYLAAAFKVDYDDAYIVGYNPKATAATVHHLLIYGCTLPYKNDSYWDVGDMGGNCVWNADVSTILWAWALDAPKFIVPDNVGFHIGKNAKIDYLLLQIHYKYKFDSVDTSGVDVLITRTAPPRLAGIYLFATGGTDIPPHSTVNADTTCKYTDDVEMVPFAFRTHTHKLGVRVSAWREREGTWTLLGSGDPQKPQMFYLMKGEKHPIRTGDTLHARCIFTSNRNTTTVIGATGDDEMCNFYMMYHVSSSQFRLEEGCFRERKFTVPEYARVENQKHPAAGTVEKQESPENATVEEKETPRTGYELEEKWNVVAGTVKGLGQIGGLSHSADNKELVVFHRAGNDWSAKRWFDDDNVVLYKEAIIKDNVILFVDPVTGNVTHSFGGDLFVMPHGVYVDHHGNTFVTDVALHQVLKFDNNTTTPSLVIGTKFEPGSDSAHFCKPTSVVVNEEDFIFVGDGYCNARVVKFSKTGKYIGEYGNFSAEKGSAGQMNLVHDLTIDHAAKKVYVADRENGQIHTMSYKGEFTEVWKFPGSVYAIEYIPETQSIAAVNNTGPGEPSKVMLVDPKTGKIRAVVPHNESVFSLPHALTHLRNIGIFLGEITSPFHVWKLSHTNNTTDKHTDKRLEISPLQMLTSHIPLSFIIVIIVLAVIPILYLTVVLITRCRRRSQTEKFDKNGFQKLLRDYDSSDEEEDLVFKNSKVYR